jgi:MFS family permease
MDYKVADLSLAEYGRKELSLARNRDFTALWVGGTISELGTRATTFAMPLVGYAVTGSAGWAAACEALYVLGMVAALLPAGVLADRVDRLRLLRASLGGGAVLYLSLVVAGTAGALTLPHLLAGSLGSGLLAGLYQPVESSAIRSVVPVEQLPTALSQPQGRQHIASLLGGPLGGVLFGLAEAATGLSGIAGALVAPWLIDRLRTGLLTIAIAWSFVPIAIPNAVWNHPLAMAAAATAAKFLVPAGNAGMASYRITITPPALVGRVQATTQFVSMLAMPLAPLLGGLLLELAGGRQAVLVLGALTGAVALVPTLSRAVRAVPRPAAWPKPPGTPTAPSPGLLAHA